MIILERFRNWLNGKSLRADTAAIILLTLLWAFFFWRVLTPNPADQVSYPAGDFSGQFIPFGTYQAERLLAGEIPLWNPYNYGGSPFIGDTQSAVFYPPRLLTIFLSLFTGGWGFAALQAEAIAHYWLGAMLMYLFARTITGSRIAGIVSALTVAYGGYQTGYPPLQLAVLEAGIWLPLCLLGVYRASQGDKWHLGWLSLSAFGVGISLLAGHPQTSLYLLYVLAGYILHRGLKQELGWLPTGIAIAATSGLGFGIAAVQILPGLEYTSLTIRAGYGFDEMARGFPFTDLIIFLLPNVFTVFSPLYSGIAALALAGVAVWQKHDSARFWLIVVLIAVGMSFGGATILYKLAYLLAPGFSLFRQQERAAYLIAHGVALLAGMGTASLLKQQFDTKKLGRVLGIACGLTWFFALELIIADGLTSNDLFELKRGAMFLAVLTTGVWLLLGWRGNNIKAIWWSPILIALIVFDLFSLTMDTNWEPISASERDFIGELVLVALEDENLFRVDGRLGLGENFGTQVGLQDIRGISPLRLESLDNYLTALPQYRLHQLLTVKYVFTDWQSLEVPSTIIGTSQDGTLSLVLHEIDEPMPRAWMAYQVMVTPDDAQALGWISDPSFDIHNAVILNEKTDLDLPDSPPEYHVEVEIYQPEQIILHVETPADGVLVLSEFDTPGWHVTINGEEADILRANAGLRSVALESGDYEIEFQYRPASVQIGTVISLSSILILIGGGLSPLIMRRRKDYA